MLACFGMVAAGGMGMVRSFFVVTFCVFFVGSAMMLCCFFMMFRSLFVVRVLCSSHNITLFGFLLNPELSNGF